jgi:type I restriction enzyme S subunit
MPSTWRTKKLGELLDVQNGYAFDSERFSDRDGVPLIRIRDLKNGHDTAVRYAGEYDGSYLVNAGDLLIGMDGEFRCYTWHGDRALLNQRVCRLIDFSDDVEPEFVAFGVDRFLKQIEDATPFVTVKHLSAKSIKAIEFPYPDRAEQRRIVSRIKACIERADEIETLRAVAAEEAAAITPSLLNDVFVGVDGTSPSRSIGAVAVETRYGTSQKCHAERTGVPVLRIPNVAAGAVNFDDLKFCEPTREELERISLAPGDLLFVRTNGSRDLVGRCAVFEPRQAGEAIGFASYLIRVRLDPEQVLPRYLAYFLNSTKGREEINQRRRTSAGQFNINSENLRSISFPVPPVWEQAILIGLLEERDQLASKMRTEMDAAREEGTHLRESILRRAFAGEL